MTRLLVTIDERTRAALERLSEHAGATVDAYASRILTRAAEAGDSGGNGSATQAAPTPELNGGFLDAINHDQLYRHTIWAPALAGITNEQIDDILTDEDAGDRSADSDWAES